MTLAETPRTHKTPLSTASLFYVAQEHNGRVRCIMTTSSEAQIRIRIKQLQLACRPTDNSTHPFTPSYRFHREMKSQLPLQVHILHATILLRAL